MAYLATHHQESLDFIEVLLPSLDIRVSIRSTEGKESRIGIQWLIETRPPQRRDGVIL